LLTIVLGGAVALLYKQIEAERARNEAERPLQRQLHTEIVQAYNATKKIRRLLRADASDSHIRVEFYDKQLQLLIDAQLSFESFVSRIRSNPKLFSRAPELEVKLKSVEKYLNHIVTEYEQNLSLIREQDEVPLSRLPLLGEYIGPLKSATAFKSQFTIPFREALADLEKLMTAP
jgi:hypothetical protein